MKNNIIIDYLSFTIKNESEDELVGNAKLLHDKLEAFCSKYCSPLNKYIGGHLYTKGYMSFDGFRTFYGGSDTGHTMLIQISGSGCIMLDRYFEGGLFGFLMYILKYTPKITRLDLAADEIGEEDLDPDYCLYPDRLDFYSRHGLCTGSARQFKTVCGFSNTGDMLPGFTFYAGSFKRRSNSLMRIYDKKAERDINGPGHWMRCELELRGDKAREVYVVLTSCEDFHSKIKELYEGICLDLCRFIDERKSNVTRSVTSEWWTNFLDGCEVGYKFTNPQEYKTIDKLMQWVDHSVLGALKVVYETYGFEYLYTRMNEFVKEGRLSAAHMNMILEFDKEEQKAIDERNGSNRSIPPGTDPPKQFFSNVEVL